MADVAYAQEIIIDPNGNVGFKPTLQRATRPQVVDIATPNSGGVSHNQYSRFDVTNKGVVLNNSQGTVKTRVAGTIAGNANLAGGTASTIVNEVTSTRASELTYGTIEVAGDRAGVIIANPNGITCHGCSFINASDATLTTGVPIINGGNVTLDVRKGTVRIGRRGLDGTLSSERAINNINLIGRTVVIDGKVKAIEGINVQGGAQRYDLTNQRHIATLSGTEPAPDFVVDGTEYGAMEAGRIQIIGNEQGLGVRALGAMHTTADDFNLRSQGNATLRSVQSAGRVIVGADQNVEIERDVVAGEDIHVHAEHDLVTFDRTGFFAQERVFLRARYGDGQILGDIQTAGDVDVRARALTFGAYVSAGNEAKFQGHHNLTFDGATIVASRALTSVSAPKRLLTLQNTAVFSLEDFQVTANDFRLGKDVVVDGLTSDSESNLVVNATGHFRNASDLRRHDAATINYAGNLYNEAGGIIEEDRLKIVSSKEIHNSGVIFGTSSIDLNVAQLFNNESGSILSDSIKIVTSGALENKGTINSSGNLYLTSSREIENDGYVQAVRAYLTAPTIVNAGNGEFRVRDYGQVEASRSFTNEGVVGSLAALKVSTGRFTNQGVVSVDTYADINADFISNEATLTAGERFYLRSAGEVRNSGILASYGHAYFTSGSTVLNEGDILVDGVADIRSTWFENRGEAALVRAKTGRIYSENIRNSGGIYLIDAFSRSDLNHFENSGVFASQGAVTLKGRDAASRAYFRDGGAVIAGLQAGDEQALVSNQHMTIAFSSLTLGGRLASGGNLNLSGPAKLTMNSELQAGLHLYLNAGTVALGRDAQVIAGGNAYLTATSGFTNDGVVSLDGQIRLSSGTGNFTNRGVVTAAETSGFYIHNGSFLNSGIFQMAGAASIVAANITNSGHIEAGSTLTLNAQKYAPETYVDSRGNDRTRWVATDRGDISSTGTLSAVGQSRLAARRITLGGDSYLSADLMHVTADRFYNKGSVALSGDARNEWRVAETLYQYGQTYADGDIRLYSAGLATYSGSLIGAGNSLTLNVTNAASISGSLTSDILTLTAGSIYGAATSSIISSEDMRLTSRGSLKLYGEAAAGDDLIIRSDTFDVRGNLFGERVSLAGEARGYTRGSVFANETLTIDLDGSLYNYGLLEARDQLTLTAGTFGNYADGVLSSTEIDLRTTGAISNYGNIAAASRVSINSGATFTNDTAGELSAVSFGLTSKGLTNKGTIDVFGLFADVNGRADNYGSILARTYFGLEADAIYNRANARMTTGDHLYIKTTVGGLATYDGSLIKGNVVDLRVKSLSNSGSIEAEEVVNVANATGDIRNNATGTIYGAALSFIGNGSFRNEGRLGGSSRHPNAEIINVSAGKGIDNRGHIVGDDIRFVARESFANRADSSIKAAKFLGVRSSGSSVSNQGILSGEAILINSRTDVLNERRIQATQEVFIDADGKITNRDGTSTTAEIKAPIVSLVAATNIDNNGILAGADSLGIVSQNGRIYNNGRITGTDIAVLAARGGVYSPAGITAGETLVIEARNIALRGRTRAADGAYLTSSHYDIEVEDYIETNTLLVDAARNVKAAGSVFRGSDRTQIEADNIQRIDTTAGNRKLGTIYGARGDIYVRLRSGNLGTWASNDGSGNSYESVNWDVTRSVTLLAKSGNILLSGRIQADDNIFVRATNGNTGIKDIRFDAGKTLHLEGGSYLKKNGWWNPGTSANVQLSQKNGWFYTDDWLRNRDVHHNLTVEARKIVVNSSHRFVNKKFFLRAREDISQKDEVISARELVYSAGRDVLIKFDPFAWRAKNSGARATSDWWDVTSAGLRGHTLIAQKKTTGIDADGNTQDIAMIFGGRDVTLRSGKIHSGGNLKIVAGRLLLSEPIYRTNTRANVPDNVGWSFSGKYRDQGYWSPPANTPGYTKDVSGGDWHRRNGVAPEDFHKVKELRAYHNQITSSRDVTLVAGGIDLIGTLIKSSNGNIKLEGHGGVRIASAFGYRKFEDSGQYRTGTGWFDWQSSTVKWNKQQYDDIFRSSELSARNGSIEILSEGNVLSAGTKIFAGTDLTVKSNTDSIVLGTYLERHFRKYADKRTVNQFWGGGSQSNSTVLVDIPTGNYFSANEVLKLSAKKDLTLIGGKLEVRSGRAPIIQYGRNLNILAAITQVRQTSYSRKENLFTITTVDQGSIVESAALPEIITNETIEFNPDANAQVDAYRGTDLNRQLLATIGTKRFDEELSELYTPPTAQEAAAQATEIEQKYLRNFDLPGASDGQQFAYLDTLIQDYGATYNTFQLRDQQWYDKQVQLTPAFQALLQAVATYVTSGVGAGLGIQNAFIAAGVDAAVANLASGIVGGAITGDIDMDEILRGAILAGVSTTISGFITDQIDFGAGLSDTSPFANDLRGNFSSSAIVDRAGDAIVNRVVTNVVYGEDPFANFDQLGRTFFVQEALALTQFGIGELGQGNAAWEGSVAHLVLHGTTGCLASKLVDGNCASGFAAGASSSLLAGSSLSDEQKQALSPLIGSLAAFPFSEGEAINVSFGGTISASAIENNYLTHEELRAFRGELQDCAALSGDAASACYQSVETRYRQISGANNQRLINAINSGDQAEIRRAMRAAEGAAAVREEILRDLGPTSTASDVFEDVYRDSLAISYNGSVGSYDILAFTSLRDLIGQQVLDGDAATGDLVALGINQFGAGVLLPNASGILGAGAAHVVLRRNADGTTTPVRLDGARAETVAGGTNPRPIRASDANATHELPPYATNRPITEFDADGSTRYVRVYTEGTTGQAGSWMMRASDIEGLSPNQIQNRFDLPYTPTHVTDVLPPQGTVIRTGTVNSGNFGGSGGGTQFQLMDRIPVDSFTNGRPLE